MTDVAILYNGLPESEKAQFITKKARKGKQSVSQPEIKTAEKV